MSTAKQSASVFATRTSLIFVSLILSVIVNRMIGPQNRGVLELLSTIPVLLVNIGNLGLGNASLYFLGKRVYPERDIIANSISSTFLVSGVIACCLCAAYVAFPQSLFGSVPTPYFLIVLLMIPLLLLSKVLYYILLGKGKIYLLNRLQVYSSLLGALLILIFVALLRMDVLGVLLSTLITTALVTLVYVVVTFENLPVIFFFSRKFFREAVRFGMVPFLALAVMNLIFRSDVFLVKYFLSDIDLGYYGLGVSLCERIWILPESIGLVILAKAAHSTDDESTSATARVCRMTLWLTAGGSALLFILAPYLIPALYGTPFAPAILPLQILLPGIAMISVFLVLHSDLTGRGEAKCTLYVFLVFLILNVLMNIILIPRMGIAGSALSSSVSYGGGAFVLAVVYARKYQLRLKDLFFVNRDDWRQVVVPLFNKVLCAVRPASMAIKQ